VFLSTRDRYRFLFEIGITDYKGWARGLKSAGYATNPAYADILIRIIEENDLYELDSQFVPGKILILSPSDQAYQESPIEHPKPIDSISTSSFHSTYRRIYENNGVKFIFAKKDDSFYKIAQDLNIYTYQVYRYNELKWNDPVFEGQLLYVEKKRRKSDLEIHVVKEGQSLYEISQIYAIRLKRLKKMNGLNGRESLMGGQFIILNPKANIP
jgi:LysM repeat protein